MKYPEDTILLKSSGSRSVELYSLDIVIRENESQVLLCGRRDNRGISTVSTTILSGIRRRSAGRNHVPRDENYYNSDTFSVYPSENLYRGLESYPIPAEK